MSKQSIKSLLNQPSIKMQLTQAGIVHLWLFGSQARGDATVDSDVDLLYEWDAAKAGTSWGVFGVWGDLEEVLGSKVDLVSKKTIHPLIKEGVMNDLYQIY